MKGTIFRPKTEQYSMSKKMYGAYLPIEQVNHLTLYALFQNMPKSQLLNKIVTEYISQLPTEETLLKKICKMVLKDWKEKLDYYQNHEGWETVSKVTVHFTQYKQELEKDLRIKKIPYNYIDAIVEFLEKNYLE